MTETDRIITQIEFAGRGRSNKDITRSILDEWRGSQLIADMVDAEKYYMCRNVSIQEKSRSYIDAAGNKQENSTLSNARIPHAFLRTNVQQKVNYAVGKPFTLSMDGPVPDTIDEVTGEIRKDPKKLEYLNEWESFVSPGLRMTIRHIVKDAVNKGIGWAYLTIIDGKLSVISNRSEQLYPAWADEAHTMLDAAVRDYTVIAYLNGKRTEITKIEYWDTNSVERFVEEGEELLPDTDTLPVDAHMKLGDGGISWGRVPFIALKGNEDELPMLNVIRAQVDAYDALRSKSVDALNDDVDPVLAVVGISPDMGDLIEARQKMQNSRIMSIETGGQAAYVQVNADISAVLAQLESLKKDIREFGQAVDTQDIRFGSNPSGVALKSMYQDLDIYINGIENEFEVFMQNLKYFFDIWLEFRGIGTVEQWSEYTLTVTLNRDMMINASADITDTVALGATGVSQETMDEYNPAVESHAIEQDRRKREALAARGSGDDAVFTAEVQKALKEKMKESENGKNA